MSKTRKYGEKRSNKIVNLKRRTLRGGKLVKSRKKFAGGNNKRRTQKFYNQKGGQLSTWGWETIWFTSAIFALFRNLGRVGWSKARTMVGGNYPQLKEMGDTFFGGVSDTWNNYDETNKDTKRSWWSGSSRRRGVNPESGGSKESSTDKYAGLSIAGIKIKKREEKQRADAIKQIEKEYSGGGRSSQSRHTRRRTIK